MKTFYQSSLTTNGIPLIITAPDFNHSIFGLKDFLLFKTQKNPLPKIWVTGEGASLGFSRSFEALEHSLGGKWKIHGEQRACPADVTKGLQSFADSLHNRPEQREIYFCPAWGSHIKAFGDQLRGTCKLCVIVYCLSRSSSHLLKFIKTLIQRIEAQGGSAIAEVVIPSDDGIIIIDGIEIISEGVANGTITDDVIEKHMINGYIDKM